MSIDNIILEFEYFQISFYSFMYLISYVLVFILMHIYKPFNLKYYELRDIFFLLVFSSIIGGRIGHVFLYEWSYYKSNLIEVLSLSRGGMSFFSSILFCSMVLYIYAKYNNKSFLLLSDFVLSFTPIGIFFGRIGNFYNNEIWGKDPYDILPKINVIENNILYQKIPIVLYEAFFEGLLLFVLLQYLLYKKVALGVITIVFLFFYSFIRFILEFFKYPYSGEYILNYFTLSQFLAFMVLFVTTCVLVYIRIYNRRLL